MKIYTRTGDGGTTGLFGGERVPKHTTRVSAYGDVDELNALLGVVCTYVEDAALLASIERVQRQLFVLGSDLATPGESDYIPRVPPTYAVELEQEIDAFEQELAPLRQFIVPGGTPAASYLHLARTVCRRAERTVTMLADADEPLNEHALPFINRLSDWLFTAARLANARAGVADIPWVNPLASDG